MIWQRFSRNIYFQTPLDLGRRLFSDSTLQSLSSHYNDLVKQQKLKEDRHQWKLIKTLEKLRSYIQSFDFNQLNEEESKSKVEDSQLNRDRPVDPTPKPRLRGLYIYGPVGSGKSMLMDMFFQSVQIQKKRRVHFHQFMLEVHKRIHDHKQKLLREFGRSRHLNLSSSHDSIRQIATEISREANLLCFDEFQVTDIADAVILSKLFGEMWSHGTVLVATSNRPPKDLYADGMNRRDFLPFIDQLEKECLVRELNGENDYRMSESIALTNTSFSPNSLENIENLRRLYHQEREQFLNLSLTLMDRSKEVEYLPHGAVKIPVSFNRTMTIKTGDLEAGICFVDFTTLCEEDRGASDYKALTKYFHSVYLFGIPRLSKLSHNSARRFITLIDELYNHNIRLLFVSETNPSHLFDEQEETWEEIDAKEEPEINNQALSSENNSSVRYGRNHEYSKFPPHH